MHKTKPPKKYMRKLKKSGIILTDASNHSDSNIYCLVGKVNNALPQKSVPNPTNISRLIYPIKILPKERRNKGNAIGSGDSCACS